MSNSITGNKILSHIDRVLNHPIPITADIFLNNYCNNNCPYCTYKRWDFDDGARYMPLDDFIKYATRMKELGVLGFILSGGGEPSISKDFDGIVEWLDANQYAWGINTNFNRYFEGHPRYLKVSLDAWDEASYRQRRGVESYGQVRENILRFAKFKNDKTHLGIQLLATEVDQVYMFYDANKDLPVDYIVIRPVESTDGKYYEELSGERQTNPKLIIKAISNVAEEDKRVVMNYKWNLLGLKYERCYGQWSQIAINEIGEVMYCCHKPFQIVGHIMDEDILSKKIWADTDMKMCDVPCRLSGVNHDICQIFGTQLNMEFI